MKRTTLVLFLVLLAPGIFRGQDLASINRDFEAKLEDARKAVLRDKFKTLEKYLRDPKNKEAADLTEAMLAAAETGGEADLWKEARGWADQVINREAEGDANVRARLISGTAAIRAKESGDAVRNILMPVIEQAELSNESVPRTLEAAETLAGYLVDSGDKKSASKVWERVKIKLPNAQIHSLADDNLRNLDLLGTAPKAFTVKDLKGEELSLEQYQGKVVLLDFWATWCGPCVGELPNVIKTYKKHHAAGFEIVGISLDEDREALDQFLAEHDMPWRQFFDGEGWKNEVAVLYKVRSIPATYLLDREGKIARIGVRGEKLEEAVARLVAQK